MYNESDIQKPFPYWPPTIPERQLKRIELLNDLNKWDNNDPVIAKRMAEALIELLKEQFELGRIVGAFEVKGSDIEAALSDNKEAKAKVAEIIARIA